MSSVAIVVYSCLASLSFDDFNPHQLNAAGAYVAAHPGVCEAEPPLFLGDELTLEQCRWGAMLHYMPGWIKDHPDRVWLGATCESREPDSWVRSPTLPADNPAASRIDEFNGLEKP